MKFGICLFAFILSLYSAARAEYRVFLIEITKTSLDPAVPGEKNIFPSTLDPEQYRGYHPLQANESIKYLDTWLCPGRTGDFKPLCPNPREPAAETELDQNAN